MIRRRPPSRRSQRGVTLLEGLVASGVLLAGLVGVLQGVITASRQNSIANRMTRATAIAAQVRATLDAQGRSALFSPATSSPASAGGLFVANCLSNPATLGASAGELLDAGLASGTDSTSGTRWTRDCVVDLDAVETAAASANKLFPGYLAEDSSRYRRVLVLFRTQNAASKQKGEQVAVVVSWNELGQRRFVRQFIGFYDTGDSGNATNTEI